MTFNGAAGDSGMHAEVSFLSNPSSVIRDRLGASTEDIRTRWRNRALVRQSPCYSIGHGLPVGQTMFIGLDNRDILPPFFPGYNNNDGIHGLLVGLCVRDSCTAHVPLILQHLPEPERTNRVGDVGRLKVSDLVIACCSSWSPTAGMETVDRMRALGAHLESLGSLSETEFRNFLVPRLYGRLGSILSHGNAVLKSQNSQPAYWAAELTAELDRYSAAAVDLNYLVPCDLIPELRASSMTHIQQLVRHFGEILFWWPEIVRGTRELASSGVTLGRRIGLDNG